MRHEAVASRVFDEAERALSEFLREEEERPADHYFALTLSGDVSPLASEPAHEFVVSYFQLDSQGVLSGPRPEAEDDKLAELRSSLGRAPARRRRP